MAPGQRHGRRHSLCRSGTETGSSMKSRLETFYRRRRVRGWAHRRCLGALLFSSVLVLLGVLTFIRPFYVTACHVRCEFVNGSLVFFNLSKGWESSGPRLADYKPSLENVRDFFFSWVVIRGSIVSVPLCWPALSIWIIVMTVFLRRNRRIALSCSQCGYCLYGNESGICPECGNRVTCTQ